MQQQKPDQPQDRDAEPLDGYRPPPVDQRRTGRPQMNGALGCRSDFGAESLGG